MHALQILVDGFVISSLYALGAIGFTLIFGVSGVLNLAHGATVVVAALIAWFAAGNLHLGVFGGSLAGIVAALLVAQITYFLIVRPIQRSPRIPDEEREIFVLTGTMLFALAIETGMSFLFSDNPVTIRPFIGGVTHLGNARIPSNVLLITACCWAVIGLLWFMISRTRAGKAMLAASMNPRGLSLLGFELSRIHALVWVIYGVFTGIAGVLLASFTGTGTSFSIDLTASAFAIVVLGGLGSVSGSLIAALIVGYLETSTAYLISPTLRAVPALLLVVLVVYIRPRGLLGRA